MDQLSTGKGEMIHIVYNKSLHANLIDAEKMDGMERVMVSCKP